VLRGREARLGELGERSSRTQRRNEGGTHLDLRRNASPFAGRCGKRRSQRLLTSAFARKSATRRPQNAREGPPLEALRARRTRCAEPVRGGDSAAERRREPSLVLARSRRPRFLGSLNLRGSSAPCLSFLTIGRHAGESGKRERHLLSQNEESMRLVVGARPSSYCRSRKDALGLREARHP